ncbi:MAG: 3-oxoacyl-[acyl-carrier-protein] synthase III C-terminal domain-containing protein [Terriglobales bacterium]
MVERCLRSVLPPATDLPGEDEDWIESGLLDSMAHVEVLMQIERAAGSPDLFARAGVDPPTTTLTAMAAIQKALAQSVEPASAATPRQEKDRAASPMAIAGWGSALGSERVPIAQVEKEFGLPPGKLSQGAGLEAVCRASANEDEVSLARVAAQRALEVAGVAENSLDWILATSETLVGFPSLGALLHSALLAPQTCAVLDVGGACAGAVNCLIVADALFAAGRAKCVLIASADVHSRLLVPGKVPGEFGGLFGDGASAFLLRSVNHADDTGYRLVAGMGSCLGTYASAIQVRQGAEGAIQLRFDGEALAHAAVDRMALVLDHLEAATGKKRDTASAIVIHQPNPRIVEIFLRRAKLPPEKIPVFTRTTGNLGSSTCGLALSAALEEHSRKPRGERGPIFLAALGPGLLWAGALLD